MGVNLEIGGVQVHPDSYTISESSMPLAGGDSSGAVGTMDFSVARMPKSPTALNLELDIDFLDTNKGSSVGKVRSITQNRTGSLMYDVSANNRLGEFNIEVQAQPVSDTLENAFRYYCSLANIDTGIVVDPEIANLQVNFPGWDGNLWNHMKMMAQGVGGGTDLNLISNNVVLRPVRKFEGAAGRDTANSNVADGTNLALKQEVVWRNTRYVNRGLIYPPGGWDPEVRVYSVNAGEKSESTLETNASIFSIEQPTPVASVDWSYDSSSVYTIVGDDGIVIQPQQWLDYGGSLRVSIDPDTTNLTLTLKGASGLRQADGSPIKTFRVAMASGSSSSDTYSSLRIVGRFVEINEQTITVPTGVDEWRTGQEFAPTVDNPFLNTLEQAYSAGVRGARKYAGRTLTLSSTVTAINKRGNTGTANYPPYSVAQDQWAGMTYGAVNTSLGASTTYADVKADFYASVQDNFDNQAFGNAPGARVWDEETRRWYRVRSSRATWDAIAIEADDDLLNGDLQQRFQGMTYGGVQSLYNGLQYREATMMGIPR